MRFDRFPPRGRRSRALSPEEKELWDHVTRFDRLILPASERPEIMQDPPPPVPPPPSAPAMPSKPAPAPRAAPPAPERGLYDNIDRRSAERFRKGKRHLDGVIDLHGLSHEAAYFRLQEFIESSYIKGRRVVLVITGKGRGDSPGILKTQLPRWFADYPFRPLVLAFDFAQPKDGGSGAYYVLLRRKRSE